MTIVNRAIFTVILLYLTLLFSELAIYLSLTKFKSDQNQNMIFKQNEMTAHIEKKDKIVRPIDFLVSENFKKIANKYGAKYMLGAQPNKRVFVCDEEYPVYTKLDHLGLRNNNSDYKKKINALIVGDSAAFGECVNDGDNIKGYLNSEGVNALNFSIGGAGPRIYLDYLKLYEKVINKKLEFLIIIIHSNDFGQGQITNLTEDESVEAFLNHYQNVYNDIESLFNSPKNLSYNKINISKNSNIEKINNKNELNRYLKLMKQTFLLTRLKSYSENLYARYYESNFENRKKRDLLNKLYTKSFKFCLKYQCDPIFVLVGSNKYLDKDSFSLRKDLNEYLINLLEKNKAEFDKDGFYINSYNFLEPYNSAHWPAYGGHMSQNGYQELSKRIISLILRDI